MKQVIGTSHAPQAIGTYSQAIKAGSTVYISGQIPLVPETMEVENGEFADRVARVFKNLQAVAEASGGSLANIVKLTVYLTDMNNFAIVNDVMAQFCKEPYPARAAVGVQALPKGVDIEMDAILVLGD
jgi:reactive intermediate/imine deaminase